MMIVETFGVDSKPDSSRVVSRISGTGTSMRGPMMRAARGATTAQMMMANTRPTRSTWPTSAPSVAEAATGPGCGGEKMCIAENAIAEALTALGLPRWVSYGIVTLFLLILAGICALIGKRMISKIEKPERTLETLSDLPEVLHREAPGQRHRAVPEVSNGKVVLRGNESYKV